jgi:hypothetical protein
MLLKTSCWVKGLCADLQKQIRSDDSVTDQCVLPLEELGSWLQNLGGGGGEWADDSTAFPLLLK